MMRKLVVPVFAMSLTLVGCGSSSTTKPKDAGVDAGRTSPDTGLVDTNLPVLPDTGVRGTPDTPIVTPQDGGVLADVQVDTVGTAPDVIVAVDVVTGDVSLPSPDGALRDTTPGVDRTPSTDTRPGQTDTPIVVVDAADDAAVIVDDAAPGADDSGASDNDAVDEVD